MIDAYVTPIDWEPDTTYINWPPTANYLAWLLGVDVKGGTALWAITLCVDSPEIDLDDLLPIGAVHIELVDDTPGRGYTRNMLPRVGINNVENEIVAQTEGSLVS